MAAPDYHSYYISIKRVKAEAEYLHNDLHSVRVLIKEYYKKYYKKEDVTLTTSPKDFTLIERHIKEYMAGAKDSSKPKASYIAGIYNYEKGSRTKSVEKVEIVRFFVEKRLQDFTNNSISNEELIELREKIYNRQLSRPLETSVEERENKVDGLQASNDRNDTALQVASDLPIASGVKFDDIIKTTLADCMGIGNGNGVITEFKVQYYNYEIFIDIGVTIKLKDKPFTEHFSRGTIRMVQDSKFYFETRFFVDFSTSDGVKEWNNSATAYLLKMHDTKFDLHDAIVAKMQDIYKRSVTSFWIEKGYIKVGYENYFKVERSIGPHEPQPKESPWRNIFGNRRNSRW